MYIKKTYLSAEGSRSLSGLDSELILHYFTYMLNIRAGNDGAKLQFFEQTPSGVSKNFDAVISEVIGFIINPIFYYFR